MSCCKPDRNEIDQREIKTEISSGPQIPSPSKTAIDYSQMVQLAGGEFLMGSDDSDGWAADGEGPVRKVTLNPFWIDRTTVTNEQFEHFVDESGYVTEAEKFGWTFVFHLLVPDKIKRKLQGKQRVEGLQWWMAVEGACWKKPEGPGSNIKKRKQFPVVHVSWNDAKAYCDWSGKRLPTEAEWEYAARGGLIRQKYVWGNELTPNGKHMCNIWQGTFPTSNTAEDGFVGAAPSRSFPANGYGLYNMSGNVWEWCNDWFSPYWHVSESSGTRKNPQGPLSSEVKAMRGGSYLCHDSYCNRYRVGARTGNTPDSSTGNCGFRCVADIREE